MMTLERAIDHELIATKLGTTGSLNLFLAARNMRYLFHIFGAFVVLVSEQAARLFIFVDPVKLRLSISTCHAARGLRLCVSRRLRVGDVRVL